jgi:hypothetical protein
MIWHYCIWLLNLLFLAILVHRVHKLISKQRPSLSPMLITVWFMHDTSSDGDCWLYNFQRRTITNFKPKDPSFKHASFITGPNKRWDVSKMHSFGWKVSRRRHVATNIEKVVVKHISQLVIYPCGWLVLVIHIFIIPYLILKCVGAYQLMNYFFKYIFLKFKEKQNVSSLFKMLQKKAHYIKTWQIWLCSYMVTSFLH